MPRAISTYRYKRPPRKRKAVLLEVPAIVTKHAPRQQPSAPKPAAPANDDRKPVIVTVSDKKRVIVTAAAGGEIIGGGGPRVSDDHALRGSCGSPATAAPSVE
jgi:hypothetical protein